MHESANYNIAVYVDVLTVAGEWSKKPISWPLISLNKLRPARSPMPLTVCELNAWYLVVTCKKCGVRQPLHRDSSDGRSALLRSYRWRCIQCEHTAVYEAHEIERYQHKVER